MTDEQVEAAMREMDGKRIAELEPFHWRGDEREAHAAPEPYEATCRGGNDGAWCCIRKKPPLLSNDDPETIYHSFSGDIQPANLGAAMHLAELVIREDFARSQVSSLTSRLAVAEAERERYRELLAESTPYAWHMVHCPASGNEAGQCSCGYTEFFRETAAALSPAQEQGT